MPIEKSAGAVIFRKESFNEIYGKKTKFFYLLLHYPSRKTAKKEYWDLPKGHIEKGEQELDTARREVGEETGLKDIEFVGGFKTGIRYFFRFKGKNILKFVTFYLAETKTKNVQISEEHMGYQWLDFEKAIKQLTFKNAKDILRKANDYNLKNEEEKNIQRKSL